MERADLTETGTMYPPVVQILRLNMPFKATLTLFVLSLVLEAFESASSARATSRLLSPLMHCQQMGPSME